MHWLTSLFHKISWLFDSPKAKAIEAELAAMTQAALPIVQTIAALTPNKTVQEIAAVYEHYGVPLAVQIGSDPTSIENALLNVATAVLQKNHASATAVSLLNTAVQLAVTASKIPAA